MRCIVQARMMLCYRKEISSIISLGIDDEGLPQHLMAYINDNGHSLPSLFALNKVHIPAYESCRYTWLSAWLMRLRPTHSLQ